MLLDKILQKMGLTRVEAIAAFAIGLSAAFLLGGYEFVRSPSNTLFNQMIGRKHLPWLLSALPLVMIAVVYLYSRLLDWFGPKKTLSLFSIGTGVALALHYFLLVSGNELLAMIAVVTLYLVREAYVAIIIEQYWSLINSFFKSESAKKVNGPIIGISSFGAVLGGSIEYFFVESLGTKAMLLFAAVLTMGAAVFSNWAYRVCGEPKAQSKSQHHPFGFQEFKKAKVLYWILGVVCLSQVLSNVTGLAFQMKLSESIPDMDQQTKFSGAFFTALNAVSGIFQFVVSPILMKALSVSAIQFFVPVVQLVACIGYVFVPSLFWAGTSYFTFKVLDYSIFRGARETLYIPLSFESRFRAKEFIDVFGFRSSKGLSSLAIALVQSAGIAMDRYFGGIALGVSVSWLALSAKLRSLKGSP